MKKIAAICVAIVLSLVSSVYADFTVTNEGTWPKSWPAELEPLRKQASTLEGPKVLLLHYAIPLTKREEFESAWPHLLKVKSKGAPIVLRRAPSFWLDDKATAGVCVHAPPTGEAPIADGKDAKGNWEKTIHIELIVDGEIIDLNRIPFPADTPIIDERFSNVLTGAGAAANSGPAELHTAYPHWAGDWKTSGDLHRVLGFGPDERDRSSALSSSFQLSFDTRLNDSARQYQVFFPEHQIVATGKWHDEELDGLKNRDCVVTIHDGATFLWVTGVPFIGVHGGNVSYVEGVDSEHDALVLDYNTMPKHLSGHARDVETVAYQRVPKSSPEKQAQQSTSAEDRVAHLEDQLKTLQKEIGSLREQRLNDQLLLQLSGTWHELNPKSGTKESVPAVTPNVWRLTAFGNCDRHAIGEEVKVVVLGKLSVDASTTPARMTFKRTGPDGEANLAVGIVRFRGGLCEIAMARKLVPAGADPATVFPTEFQTTQDSDVVLLARADGVPLIE